MKIYINQFKNISDESYFKKSIRINLLFNALLFDLI